MLLWCTMAVISGAGGMLPANLGQIAGSYLVPQDRTFYVSLFSFTNAASRPLFGLVSDYFLLRWNFPRTGWYFVITILLVVGYGAAALLLDGGVHASVVLPPLILLVGLMNGACAFLEPATVSDMFDQRHYGKSFVAVDSAGVAGQLVVANYVPAYFYDKRAPLSPGEATLCEGNLCWSPTLWFVALSSCGGAIVALALTLRTRGLYRSLARDGTESNVSPGASRQAEQEEGHDDYRRSGKASTAADDYRREYTRYSYAQRRR
eukprot:COSAG04_NODE_6191_length_1388_cov_1.329713_1_plen_263_part_00